MNTVLTIPSISGKITEAAMEFTAFCRQLPGDQFFYQPEGKWSAARQTRHLIKATDTARLAFTLPRFLVRIVGGKPNRASRSYDELVARYHQKLEQGGQASGRYIPGPILTGYGKDKLLAEFTRSMERFAAALQRNRKEEELDRYLAPHPLLGKITLRELGYFTIYHCHHHQENISRMLTA